MILIKKISAMVNKTKRLYLYHGAGGAQWIGIGDAMYPIYNLPPMDLNHVAKVLDVPANKKQRDAYYMKELDDGTLEYIIEDVSEGRISNATMNQWIYRRGGNEYLPIMTENGLMFIDSSYLGPISDLTMCRVRAAYNEKLQQHYIILMDGLEIASLIQPATFIMSRNVQTELSNMIRAYHLGVYARHAEWLKQNSPPDTYADESEDEKETDPPGDGMDYAGNLLGDNDPPEEAAEEQPA